MPYSQVFLFLLFSLFSFFISSFSFFFISFFFLSFFFLFSLVQNKKKKKKKKKKAIVLEEHPNSTIVTDSVTSNGLASFIESKGGKHHRFKRGYKNVIDEGIRLNKEGIEVNLAIETSGHGAMKENHFLDDGAYLVVKILTKMALMKPTSIGTLIEEYDSFIHLLIHFYFILFFSKKN